MLFSGARVSSRKLVVVNGDARHDEDGDGDGERMGSSGSRELEAAEVGKGSGESASGTGVAREGAPQAGRQYVICGEGIQENARHRIQ